LKKHALIAPGDLRCVFLTDEKGTPKLPAGCDVLDASIFADCFVVMGFAAYAIAAGDRDSFFFAKALGESVWQRYYGGEYHTLPYPLSARYRAHSRPMILTNVNCELLKAAEHFDVAYTKTLRRRIASCQREVFEVFADASHLVREFRYADGDFPGNLFGEHINPGHVIEDMWFQLEAGDLLAQNTFENEIALIVKNTVRIGWDAEFGGFYHFVRCDGNGVEGDIGDAADEPQMKLVLDDYASKLWWVHSEALYTSLLLYDRTNDTDFLKIFEKTFDYVYKTFPNPDRAVREWIQIRTREGRPQEKVVALPVKDPYHIIRNVILIIELLEKRQKREELYGK
jgi:N-acylglucosamine 2-epimerase